MVLFAFGDYDYACRNIPSLPTCNLFFRQLFYHPNGVLAPAASLLGLPPFSDPNFSVALANVGMGINPACSIPRMGAAGGASGNLGNIANIVLCSLSVIIALALAVLAGRRGAAVGRQEYRFLFFVYAVLQVLQLLDTGGIFAQASTALSIITAVHLGVLVGFFWILLWTAFLSLQIVEDGTVASLGPMILVFLFLTLGSTYVFLDTALTITSNFVSVDPAKLHSNWLFILTIIWPAVAVAGYFLVQLGVVVRVLREKKPLALFSVAFFVFVLSQAAYFALSYKICKGTGAKVDGSFLATLLETAAVVALYFAWGSITESSWEGEAYLD